MLVSNIKDGDVTAKPAEENWYQDAANKWVGTFTEAVKDDIDKSLERKDIVKGIVKKESSYGHWGYGGQSHRMTSGSEDSRMSLGYGQIQSRYIYGLDASTNSCTQLRDNSYNYLDPQENVKSIAIWTQHDTCGRSFDYAFSTSSSKSYTQSYDNTGNEQVLRAKYGTTEKDLLLQVDDSVSTFTDGSYEKLVKGIAGYNQGYDETFWNVLSLPEMFKTINSCSAGIPGNEERCIGLKYALEVLKNAGYPKLDYVWRVLVKTNTAPVANEYACFEFGASRWPQYSWETVKNAAIADLNLTGGAPSAANPSVKIACPVAVPVVTP